MVPRPAPTDPAAAPAARARRASAAASRRPPPPGPALRDGSDPDDHGRIDKDAVVTMLDDLIAWGTALRPLRDS
jgi:hypothetical protein